MVRTSFTGFMQRAVPAGRWWLLVLALALAGVAGHAPWACAKLIDLDPDYFGTREFGVDERGYFRGVILNVSTHVLAGVQVEIVAQKREGGEMWRRTISLPPLKPTQRALLEVFVGLQDGQPASYDVTYRMDDTVGKNPVAPTTTTQRKKIGFNLAGLGDFRSAFLELTPGSKTIALEYQGEDVAVVLLLPQDGSAELPLFELQGPDNATTQLVLETGGQYAFYVDGEGAWSIQWKDEPPAQAPGAPQAQESSPSAPAAPLPTAAPRARQQQLIVE
ncbi:hypothetical protein [Megalodesulfovibrio gigas]|uniref:Uncharacterized protein n=1 Tax=Megalodesulfovibrio gigas (strain ATCC 19364 / DSM 1382 / NCIMB 9332 / VKM B-1759) TaxID=1121448 RepID=T2GEN6_MEGG1|nr:hypothetical protein [Megalodesulfovibrio gigas]AGW14397.1 hypothetical protein DGI_2666 [Megalodesulfovibrio gigas DSM 1382 = ATCC 19364]